MKPLWYLGSLVKSSIFFILVGLLLSSCNPEYDDFKIVTGPEIEILNVIDVGLSIDTQGEIVLKGGVSIPTPIHTEIFDVNWNVGFEKVLVAASSKTNHLYIVWEDENGQIHSETYDIQKPFNINFAKEDWVRNISNRGQGTIVVAIEKQKFLAEANWQPTDKDEWSNIVSVRMPSLNEIRDDLLSIWDANLLDVKDIPSPGKEPYHGTANPDKEYLWSYYWCAKNKETIVYDWPRGQKLDMLVEYVFDTEVNDGVKSYPPGKYQHILIIEVAD